MARPKRLLDARRWLLSALAIVVVVTTSSPAAAEWRRAESPRFVVYSDGSESALRAYVQKLETFDRVLRTNLNRPADALPDRKFPIYLVRGRAGLNEVSPGLAQRAVGVYFPLTEDIFAVAIREADDHTLFHEYAHHFMFQEFSGLYPAWLIEGFAEYYATADIKEERVVLGEMSINRAYWLANTSWVGVSDLLGKRYSQVRREDQVTYYPLAWLLAHWFLSDRGRNQQLETYLTDIRAGGDPVEAMARATGLSPSQLQAALRSHFNSRLPARRFENQYPVVPVSITVLAPSADDLLLIGQRLKIGVATGDRATTAAEVARRAARHPDDPFALLQLGHAQLHFGDADAGQATLSALIEREPTNVEAMQLLAGHQLKLATDKPEAAQSHFNAANALLRRALEVDGTNYRTYMLLGQLRERLPTYPTPNDILIWESARQIAPQVHAVTMGLAGAYLRADRRDAAIAVLTPLANAPHGGGAATAAETLLQQARTGTVSEADLDAAEVAGDTPPTDPNGPDPDAEPQDPETPPPPA